MLYILVAMVSYTLAIILGTYATRNANLYLVNAIVNGLSAIIPLALVFINFSKATSENSKLGILMAVLCGIAITIFTIALTKSYNTDKVAIVAPLIFGGSIFLSAILSLVIFKEKITTFQGAGLLFLGIGLAFIIYSKLTNS